MGKQERLNPNILYVMRSPLDTEQAQRKENVDKSATRKWNKVSFLLCWPQSTVFISKDGEVQIEGWGFAAPLRLSRAVHAAGTKGAARQLITSPVDIRKSHPPFLAQLPSVMERSHSSGYILVLCDEACGVNTKEALSPPSECEHWSE